MNRVTLGTFQASDLAKRLVMEALDSGRISYGEKSAEYERRFAAMHGCTHGVVSNSGTSSLQVAVQALKEMNGWQEGKAEVIVPAVTFVATVNVLLHNRLKPVLVDVDAEDYCMDLNRMHDAINDNTVAIMPVHLFGHPANMPEIKRTADFRGLSVVEDACEAMLAAANNRRVGSWGDVGCFSTYAAHHMVTGVGGMATTRNPKLASYMRSLVNHGISLEGLPTGERYDPSFLARKFLFDKVGHSFRVTEMEAALGLAQLDQVEDDILVRRQNAHMITEALRNSGTPVILPKERDGFYHSWMVYPILLDCDMDKRRVMASLNRLGVETRDMMPLITQPCYQDLGIVDGDYPNAEYINDYGFYVGCHQGLNTEQLAHLVNSINASIAENAHEPA